MAGLPVPEGFDSLPPHEQRAYVVALQRRVEAREARVWDEDRAEALAAERLLELEEGRAKIEPFADVMSRVRAKF